MKSVALVGNRILKKPVKLKGGLLIIDIKMIFTHDFRLTLLRYLENCWIVDITVTNLQQLFLVVKQPFVMT